MNCITIEEQLDEAGYVLSLSVGTSMRPIIRQRTEQLLIERIDELPKKRDVVLFKRSGGKYVLHRIVKVQEDHYLIRGDNCYNDEVVYPTQLVGILKGFYRGDRFVDCQKNICYKMYVSIWLMSYPVRTRLRFLAKNARALRAKIRGRGHDSNQK